MVDLFLSFAERYFAVGLCLFAVGWIWRVRHQQQIRIQAVKYATQWASAMVRTTKDFVGETTIVDPVVYAKTFENYIRGKK